MSSGQGILLIFVGVIALGTLGCCCVGLSRAQEQERLVQRAIRRRRQQRASRPAAVLPLAVVVDVDDPSAPVAPAVSVVGGS